MKETGGGLAVIERDAPVQTIWPSDLEETTRRIYADYLAHQRGETGFAVIGEVAVNCGPVTGIACTHDGRRLLVTNYGDNSVAVIDTHALTVVDAITAIGEPFVAAASTDRVYVNAVSPSCDAILAVDPHAGSVVATHRVAFSVRDVAVSPDGRRAFASRMRPQGADVAIIDTACDRVKAIELPGRTATELDVSPDGRRLYVGIENHFGAALVVIDTRAARVVSTIKLRSPVRGIACSNDSGSVYVATDDLVVVDARTNKITECVEIDGSPLHLALSSDGDRAYLVCDDHVVVFCTVRNEVIDRIDVAEPSCVTESPDGRALYVAGYTGKVTAIAVTSG